MSNSAERGEAHAADEARRRRLDEALDKVVHVVERGGLGERRRFLVTQIIEVEAADEDHAIVLAAHGEGIKYAPQVEPIS